MRKYINLIRLSYLLLIIGAILLLQMSIHAQTEKFAFCYEKKMWLINGDQSVSIGTCNDENKTIPIILKDTKDEIKLSEQEVELNERLKNISNENFQPLPLEKSDIKFVYKTFKEEFGTIRLYKNQMPKYVEIFFKQIEGVIITSGVTIIATPKEPNYYEESDRYVIDISNKNMTIEELLEKLKKSERDRITGTEREWKLTIKLQDSYHLKTVDTQQVLDSKKTIADYNLKNGTVLKISTSVR